MLEFVTEKQTVWEYLSRTEKPILLYGMGDGADKILRVFSDYGIVCSGIFASDEFVRGHSFRGFRVMTYAQACETYPDCIVVLAFAALPMNCAEKFAVSQPNGNYMLLMCRLSEQSFLRSNICARRKLPYKRFTICLQMSNRSGYLPM